MLERIALIACKTEQGRINVAKKLYALGYKEHGIENRIAALPFEQGWSTIAVFNNSTFQIQWNPEQIGCDCDSEKFLNVSVWF